MATPSAAARNAALAQARIAAPQPAAPPPSPLPPLCLTCSTQERYPSGASYACDVQSPPRSAAARPSSACSTSSRAACVGEWGQGRVEDGVRGWRGSTRREEEAASKPTSTVAASFSSYSSPARTCGSTMGGGKGGGGVYAGSPPSLEPTPLPPTHVVVHGAGGLHLRLGLQTEQKRQGESKLLHHSQTSTLPSLPSSNDARQRCAACRRCRRPPRRGSPGGRAARGRCDDGGGDRGEGLLAHRPYSPPHRLTVGRLQGRWPTARRGPSLGWAPAAAAEEGRP